MSLHGKKLSVMGAIDYGSNSNPTRRWPQFTIVEEVDVEVHTELSFSPHGETKGTMGHEATQALPMSDRLRRRRFFDKTCGISDHEGFT